MTKKQTTWTYILLALYLLILVFMILLKGSFSTLDVLFLPEFRNLVLTPTLNARDTPLNFLAFVPVGILTGLLQKSGQSGFKWLKPVLLFFLLSLSFEALQYLLALGTSDITDLISNTLGGAAGLGVCYAFKKRMGERANKPLLLTMSALIALLLAFLVARELWVEVFAVGQWLMH